MFDRVLNTLGKDLVFRPAFKTNSWKITFISSIYYVKSICIWSFLVRIFLHLDWIRRRENTDQKTPNTDTFDTLTGKTKFYQFMHEIIREDLKLTVMVMRRSGAQLAALQQYYYRNVAQFLYKCDSQVKEY